MNVMPVFVFGSNLRGMHGGGAARHAFEFYGAQMGVGIGRTGDAYALPTMDAALRPLPLDAIRPHVAALNQYVRATPDENFLITAVGTGIAGHSVADVRALFEEFEWPDNAYFSGKLWNAR